MTPNPRRPHPFQTSDSHFGIRPCGARWAVVEYYQVIDRRREKDDRDDDVAWFDTKGEADAEMKRRST